MGGWAFYQDKKSQGKDSERGNEFSVKKMQEESQEDGKTSCRDDRRRGERIKGM